MSQLNLLKNVDFYQTRTNARKVLKSYRRLDRIAGRSIVDLRSPIIDNMPKAESYGNKTEDAVVQHIDAEGDRNAIVAGLYTLKLTSRQILYYSFCLQETYSNTKIANELGYSKRQIERMKAEALIEFAEAYRHGKLIAYK